MIDQLLQRLTPKKLFLIDGMGALVSAFFLGVVLINFSASLGLRKSVFNFLALIPCFFAMYSACCHLALNKNWKPFLICIAMLNLLYCCLTLSLMIYHRADVTPIAWVYFIGEIIIVVSIAFIEISYARSKNK